MRASANVVNWNHNGGPDGTSVSAGPPATWLDGVSRRPAAAAARITPSVRLPTGELGVARAGVGPVRVAAFLACARARCWAWARALDFELAIELRFQCLNSRRAPGRRLVARLPAVPPRVEVRSALVRLVAPAPPL